VVVKNPVETEILHCLGHLGPTVGNLKIDLPQYKLDTKHSIPTNMKTIISTILSIIILNLAIAQTVRRVNNNVGISGTNVYSTFAAAHTAAANNDIIIIDPSTTSYGDITLTKPLKIYGNGYFLDTNTELKADQRRSNLGIVDLNTGSGGSEFYGVYMANVRIYGVSNVTLSRSYVDAMTIYNSNKTATTNTNVSNLVITRNYFGYINANPTTGYTISNVLVTNNIINYVSAATDPSIQSWVVKNNSIKSQGSTGPNITLVNSIYENNLLSEGGTPAFFNCLVNYNVSTVSSFSFGTANQNGYDIISDLTGGGVGISNDEFYKIKAGSPLKTAASDGGEVGAFGGTTPYIISGIPAIPSITGFLNTGTGDATTPVKVTISAKSNN
jgi:hypothetical protein